MLNLHAKPALLFTPASKPERFAKASEIGANGIIFDLEDGVAEKDKDQARATLLAHLSQPANAHDKMLRMIRINNLATSAGLADLQAISVNRLYFDALIYPKLESSAECNLISAHLNRQQPSHPIIGFIETTVGLSHIDCIVKNSQYLSALAFGAADYSVDVGCAIDPQAFMLARLRIVQAAALRKLACYDSPYFDFKDDEGLRNEILQIKQWGFTGKLAIHPQQISSIKSAFKPTDEQWTEAKAIITAYDAVKGEACQYRGKMIDVPVYQKAKQIIELYQNLN